MLKLVGAVLSVSAWQAGFSNGSTIISDDFTGGSGSTPAGWTATGFDSSPSSTLVESGSEVVITDTRGNGGPTLMQSNTGLGELSDFMMTVDISAMTPESGSEPEVIIAVGSFADYALIFGFRLASKQFTVNVSGAVAGSFDLGLMEHLPSYGGGAFSFQVEADNDSFRISSSTDSYDSGDILFTQSGSGLTTLDDLGANSVLIIGAESAGSVPEGTLASVSYDGVTFETVPEPSVITLSAIAAGMLAMHRRRRV